MKFKYKLFYNITRFSIIYQIIILIVVTLLIPAVYAEGFRLPKLNIPPDMTVQQFWGLPEPDGNETCEDAAYNERNRSHEDPELDSVLSEELTMERVAFIDAMHERITYILNYKYPNGSEIPEDSIKNATYVILNQHGNLSDWMAKTELEIKNPYHEINLRLCIIQKLIEKDTMSVTTKKILTHMATCIQMINSASILNIPTDNIESDLLKSECYDELYKRYKNNDYE